MQTPGRRRFLDLFPCLTVVEMHDDGVGKILHADDARYDVLSGWRLGLR